MSCGNHHATPCTEVLSMVYVYIDNECEEMKSFEVTTHLEECGPCLQEAGVYQEVKLLIARSCGGDPCPDDVRARVISRIRTVSVTWTTES